MFYNSEGNSKGGIWKRKNQGNIFPPGGAAEYGAFKVVFYHLFAWEVKAPHANSSFNLLYPDLL